ncbi:unnamed protein product [Enterobius vermicularis]|uniref:Golgin-84 n=1 Tax=Enterobius vermicularis TaxID=51028 RepID=A0A0N4UX41_ENTVE|nr:unnamed protein product [Enterobius vermicularis]
MSWLNKVTDIAEKAESLLNRLDQNAADALKKPKSVSGSVRAFPRGESQLSLRNDDRHSEGGFEASSRGYTRSYHGASSVKSFGDRHTDEDELIAFLNENKNVATSARPPSVASRASTSGANRVGSSSPKGGIFDVSDELKAQHSDTLKSLHLKESEVAVMRVSLQEAEESIKRKDAKIGELMKENELLRNDFRFHVGSNEDIAVALKKLTDERQREKESFEAREDEYAKRLESMREEKSSLVKEVEVLRASVSEMEQKSKLQNEELRLAKYNLEANKHEFDEYKQKAQKILSAKEQLLASLKENTAEGGDDSSSMVELQELRCENGLLKEDAQQSQLVIYNLKADIQDLENRLREEQKSSCGQREALLEQSHRHLSAANQYHEQLERVQLEYEFLQAEMRRQEEAVERKLAEKDVELMKLMEERKWGKKYDAGEAEQRLNTMGEKLIAKQTTIERLEGEKRALVLRLERAEKGHRQVETAVGSHYIIEMHDDNSSQHKSIFSSSGKEPSVIRISKGFLRGIDLLGLRLASFLRSPVFRIFFCIYCIALHSWVFFIILTYSPEIHPL